MSAFLAPLFGVILVLAVALWLITRWVRFVPNNRIGIIEKRFGGKGSLRSGFIALNGEAGFQPRVLRGGCLLYTSDLPRGQSMRLARMARASKALCL